MKLIFSGNQFKYETEAVMKLFFPAVGFEFEYEKSFADEEGDFCFLRRKQGKTRTLLYTIVSLNGKRLRRKSFLNNDAPEYEKNCERGLCTLMFLCLKELTGISPAWGTLTGIRPVKRVNKMLSEGMKKDEIFSVLGNKFFVSGEKLELAYLTAMTQQKFLHLIPQSFSLYVSIPFCPTRCSYCSFVSHSIASAKNLIPTYIRKLCDEIELMGKITAELGLKLDTVYFGGGTPTSIEAEQLRILMDTVNRSFNLSDIREYTVEAGRADTITAEKLRVILENGADRISINPQTMNNDVLKAIGRKHTAEQAVEAFRLAREIGFKNINMDLIAGLPEDTAESFRDTIDKVISLDPESITVHTLSLKRSANLFRTPEEVKNNPVAEMVSYSGTELLSGGYNPYYLYRQKNTLGNLENVGYARPGFESLYNIFIMEEMQSIIGVGAAASTKLVNPETHEISRVYNYKFPYEYIDRYDKMMLKKQDIIDFYTKNNAKE